VKTLAEKPHFRPRQRRYGVKSAKVGLVELTEMLGRQVDLKTWGFMSDAIRREVEREGQVQYAACLKADLDAIWRVVMEHIPQMIPELEAALGNWPAEDAP